MICSVILMLLVSSTMHAYPNGGDHMANPNSGISDNNHDIKLAADFAANEINKEHGYSCCTYKYVVKDTTNVHLSSALAGSGTTVTMVIHMAESFCTNNDLNKDTTVDDCPIQPGRPAPILTCSVTVIMHNTRQALTLGDHSCDMSTPSPVVG